MNYTLADLETFYQAKTRQENWNISHETGLWLAEFITTHTLKKILEIGTSTGVSASYFLVSGAEVTTIESNTERYVEASQNFKSLGATSITQLNAHAPGVLVQLEDKFDCVFIDCIKHYYKACTEYIILHYPKVRYIIADNIISHEHALREFIEYANSLGGTVENIGTGLMVIKLK